MPRPKSYHRRCPTCTMQFWTTDPTQELCDGCEVIITDRDIEAWNEDRHLYEEEEELALVDDE